MNGKHSPSRLWHPEVPFRTGSIAGRFFYGWAIAVVAIIAVLFSIPGQTMGFSVFTEVMMKNLGLSRVQLSSAYCLGTVTSGLSLPALGRLYDFWGGRKMVVISALATGLILFYLSLTTRLNDYLGGILPDSWKTATAFVVIGVGFYLIRAAAQGVLTMSARNLVGKWFDVKRGLVFAIMGVITSFGFSSAPKFLNDLIEQFGAEGAWAILGALTIVVMVPLGWIFFRDSPEDCGMLMDGNRKAAAPSKNPDMLIHRDLTRVEALSTFPFWAFAMSFAFFSFYSTAFTFHVESIGLEFGFAKEKMLGLFVWMAAVSVTTGLFCGWINSKTKLKWLLAGMNGGALMGAIGLMRLAELEGVALYVIGNGICGGFFGSLSGIIWPRFYGRKWLGAISGVNMSTMVIASGLGPLGFALSVKLTDSYQSALIISIFIPAILLIGSFFAGNPQRKFKNTA